jgi:two-component system, chemotaxis family, CheB/CheR fusion protein
MTTESPDSAEEQAADELDEVVPARACDPPHVVALGGTAGAIPALVAFLQAARPGGLAYVAMLHLAPEHEGTLADLLQRHTGMRVLQVHETTTLRPDSVYLVPPRHAPQMVGGDLRLGPMSPDRPARVAVDLFFRTLAEARGPHATAVVLSGLEGDGAIGIARIKERGGLTIAQDPDEAQHAGMPRAAIATGWVDWVLPAAEMPRRIARYLAPEGRPGLPAEDAADTTGPHASTPAAEVELRELLTFLSTHAGRDFADRRRATLVRRIGRRMQVVGVRELADYLGVLRTRPGEASALVQDLLAGGTNFFRDSGCFEALERHVGALFRGKSSDGVVRVWVPACATGEEAYSIAILLSEHARTLEAPPALQIFATDVDAEAIKVARAGLYPAGIAADVSKDRLRRFFTREPNGYRVRRALREQVLFAAHDMLEDPPFARLDLVSCRNLLVDFNRDAQQRMLAVAHFALVPGGRMFLGASEAVDDDSPLFQGVDVQHRLYAARTAPSGRCVSWPELHFQMLERLAPPSIVIDGGHEILHLSPNAGRYLRFGGGEPSRKLLDAIHPALRVELQAAIRQAAQEGVRVEGRPLALEPGGQPAVVRLAVAPMSDIAPGLLLVTIEALPEELKGGDAENIGERTDGRAAMDPWRPGAA